MIASCGMHHCTKGLIHSLFNEIRIKVMLYSGLISMHMSTKNQSLLPLPYQKAEFSCFFVFFFLRLGMCIIISTNDIVAKMQQTYFRLCHRH